MKFRNLLSESYFPGYYHFSHSKNLTKENLKISKPRDCFIGKPFTGGFWLAKGLSWYKYVKSNEVTKSLDNIYRVKLKSKAKIMPFKEIKDVISVLTTASKKYRLPKKTDPYQYPHKFTKWDELIKDYDGAQYTNLGDKINLASISVPSIIVWNKDAIESIELLGDIEEVIKLKTIKRLSKRGKN